MEFPLKLFDHRNHSWHSTRVVLLLFLSPPGSLTCLRLPPHPPPAPLHTCCPFGGWQATACVSGWTVARRAEGAPYGLGC